MFDVDIGTTLAHLRPRVDQLDSAGAVEIEVVLTLVATTQAWLDHVRAACAHRLAELGADGSLLPEDTLARAGRSSRRQALADVRRAELLRALPALGQALAHGRVGGEHVDVIERAARSLSPEDRRVWLADDVRIAALAAASTPDELAALVRVEVARAHRDGGDDRAMRQREATELRSWTDRGTGMVHLAGRFDPERGAQLIGRIHAEVERSFHDARPPGCPDDDRAPGHLRALALLSLTDPSTPNVSARAGAEVIVVIDERTLASGWHETSVNWATGDAELPVPSVRRLLCTGVHVPVVVDAHGVVLGVGREQRFATRTQRRALRTMYRTCAVPGCTVTFDHCQPHHITWWRHGGTTDLANLVPLCSRHHHAVHEGGWELALHPTTRVLTVTMPDGRVLSTGPPTARAG